LEPPGRPIHVFVAAREVRPSEDQPGVKHEDFESKENSNSVKDTQVFVSAVIR